MSPAAMPRGVSLEVEVAPAGAGQADLVWTPGGPGVGRACFEVTGADLTLVGVRVARGRARGRRTWSGSRTATWRWCMPARLGRRHPRGCLPGPVPRPRGPGRQRPRASPSRAPGAAHVSGRQLDLPGRPRRDRRRAGPRGRLAVELPRRRDRRVRAGAPGRAPVAVRGRPAPGPVHRRRRARVRPDRDLARPAAGPGAALAGLDQGLCLPGLVRPAARAGVPGADRSRRPGARGSFWQGGGDACEVARFFGTTAGGPRRAGPSKVRRNWRDVWGKSHVADTVSGPTGSARGGRALPGVRFLADRIAPGTINPGDLALDPNYAEGRNVSRVGADLARIGIRPTSRRPAARVSSHCRGANRGRGRIAGAGDPGR